MFLASKVNRDLYHQLLILEYKLIFDQQGESLIRISDTTTKVTGSIIKEILTLNFFFLFSMVTSFFSQIAQSSSLYIWKTRFFYSSELLLLPIP